MLCEKLLTVQMKQLAMDAVIKGNWPQEVMPQDNRYVQFKLEAHPNERIPSVDAIQDVNILRRVQKLQSASASSGVSQSWMLESSCGILNSSFQHKRMQRVKSIFGCSRITNHIYRRRKHNVSLLQWPSSMVCLWTTAGTNEKLSNYEIVTVPHSRWVVPSQNVYKSQNMYAAGTTLAKSTALHEPAIILKAGSANLR